MDWLLKNTVFLSIHGSRSYGMATELSDLDLKGCSIEPLHVREDLFHTFEQSINNIDVEEKFSYLKNPKNPKIESTIYSLRKFIKLCAAVNPNCIEILFTEPEFHLIKTKVGEELIKNRDLFISSKIKFTTTGFSYSQLYKIQRHRKWLFKNDLQKPERKNYGLPNIPKNEIEEINGLIRAQIELWNFSEFEIDELERAKLKERCWECIYHLSKNTLNWDNWPEGYWEAAQSKICETLGLKEEIVDLVSRERKYKKDLDEYNSWIHWKKNRNPERAKLEIKYGLDCKHAAQLTRLLRTGYEALTTGQILVKRPDADELLAIKNGSWSYKKILEYADEMQKKIDLVYLTTKLPKVVNYVKINELYHKLLNEHISS